MCPVHDHRLRGWVALQRAMYRTTLVLVVAQVLVLITLLVLPGWLPWQLIGLPVGVGLACLAVSEVAVQRAQAARADARDCPNCAAQSAAWC